jgi:EAL domain-containing protein (putative c-di-GMP-specific phosphodiesterase class I)
MERVHYDSAQLTAQLRCAIDADRLVLHYQPKMNLSDGSTGSVEALVRWDHPRYGLLYPHRFLPLAQQSDLIDRLTDWVIATAISEVCALGSAGAHLGLAVNISGRNLVRLDFAARVVETLDRAGIARHRLTVEVTESGLHVDPARAAIVLRRLDVEGVKVSLDDFGTGQTSLGDLCSLPVRELKIDQGFVTDMARCPAHAAIVRRIVELGHDLSLDVVGEGVESDEVLRELRAAGCTTAQGYLLGRPMSAEQLGSWLAVPDLRSLVSI